MHLMGHTLKRKIFYKGINIKKRELLRGSVLNFHMNPDSYLAPQLLLDLLPFGHLYSPPRAMEFVERPVNHALGVTSE